MKVGDAVMYLGDPLCNIFKLLKYGKSLYMDTKYFLIVGDMYEVTEVGIYHPDHFNNWVVNKKYCKVYGCVYGFPCEVFTQNFNIFMKDKYNLR